MNFLLADVRGLLGPYLNVFLITQQGWSQSAVGAVTMLSGLTGIAARTPVGAIIDATTAKRGLLVGALGIVSVCAVLIALIPGFWCVVIATACMAVARTALGPTITAITLGLVRPRELARRLGRSAAFDHAGNVVIAVVAAVIGWAYGQHAVFLLVPLAAVLTVVAVVSIPEGAIDHDRARGAEPGSGFTEGASLRSVFLDCKPLLIFACCAMAFHVANAPLLPLVGQKLAIANPAYATAMMSSCIVAAQVVMLVVAVLVGRTAERVGRKPILMVGFGILPIRAVLYTLSDDSTWLIAVQLLDGIGAGALGALMPLVLADLTRGTGRYNLALGAVGTLQGIGASCSHLLAGIIVDQLGYAAAFLTSAGFATLALGLLAWAMPETAAVLSSDSQTRRHVPRASAGD